MRKARSFRLEDGKLITVQQAIMNVLGNYKV